jgi:hypothetical protein
MRLLFYIARAYGIPVVQPLVGYLKKCRPDVEMRFYMSDHAMEYLPADWASTSCLHGFREAQRFSPDAVLCTGNYVDPRIPGLKVQIFHGVGIEKASHYKIRHFFDLYCTSGPVVTESFLRAKDKYGYFDVAETGWPKFDHILSYPKTEPLEDKPTTILYAPTFSRKMYSGSDLGKVIHDTVRPHERWLMKCHELMDHKQLEPYCKWTLANFHTVSMEDITPLLHAADVLISDTSSVIYEFLALKKPVITYRTRGSESKGLNITHVHELRSAIDRVLENPEWYIENGWLELQKVNPYLDGKCSERVIHEVEKRVGNTSFMIRKKPLNWIRKAKVMWNAAVNKGYLN